MTKNRSQKSWTKVGSSYIRKYQDGDILFSFTGMDVINISEHCNNNGIDIKEITREEFGILLFEMSLE